MNIINKINYAMANFDNPQILCNGLGYVKPKLAEYTLICTDDGYRDIPA